jgi:hypothetical protein
LSDVVQHLEFFLELAQIHIEERDQIIRELVSVLQATESVLLRSRGDNLQQVLRGRALIAKARAVIAYDTN